MAEALHHRGPDGGDIWLDPQAGIALAHRRLAIVDLTPAGAQPMHADGGRWVISFNGEIYNHLELRGSLERDGRSPSWRGHSDTETLLAAISAWGVDEALQRSVGMFAFALWDRELRTLTLARDRLGEKPLYYGAQSGVLMFASELKALRVHPAFGANIDQTALGLLLRYGYVPAPHSIHAGIRKLPPGTLLSLRSPADADLEPRSYWEAERQALIGEREPLRLSDADAVTRLDELLRQSVAGQRIADVPLGAFLSGGIDSSTVVAVMQSLAAQPVRTFTIGFPEAGFDESQHARAVARHLGTQHTELEVSSRDALELIPQLPRLWCEPLADASQIPTCLVSRLARRHVTVALSGDGGDELFGGYERYRWAQRIAAVPLALRRATAMALTALPASAWAAMLTPIAPLLPRELRQGDRADRLRKLAAVLGARSNDALYRQIIEHWTAAANPASGAGASLAVLDAEPAALRSFESRMMLLDVRSYLPDDILTKVDRAAMSASLETRVPMLDHRIVEFASRLPLHQKMRDGQGKWLLRQVLDRYVPRALVERPKAGFGVPLHEWLRGPLRDWAESLLNQNRLCESGLIDAAPVRALWQQHVSGHHDWGYRLWPVLMFEAWRECQRPVFAGQQR